MTHKLRQFAIRIIALASFTLLIAYQCYDDESYHIANRTGESIDVEIYMHWGWHEHLRERYSRLRIGDFDYSTYSFGCERCDFPAQSNTVFDEETEPGKPATLVARSSITRQLLFKREFSYEEMERAQWQFEIYDMRRPDEIVTPVFRPESTLSCLNCEIRRLRVDFDRNSYDTNPEPFHFFDREKAEERVFEQYRMYGADVSRVGVNCYAEVSYRLQKLIAVSNWRFRVEPGPNAKDDSGARLRYLYTLDGRSIDEILIRNGLAHAADNDGQHRSTLQDAEAAATAEGIGCLWG